MRLITLPIQNYDPLIHDLIKNTIIIMVIETLQTMINGEPFFDKSFLNILIYTVIGNFVFYLIIDKYIVGAGPVLSGKKDN